MTPEEFNQFDEHFMKKVNHVLTGKGKHYTIGEDRFSNFREAATLGNTEPDQEMLAAMRKHVIGFFTLFRRGRVDRAKFIEHGGDIINYIRLLNGFLQEGAKDEFNGCNLPDCTCHVPGQLCHKE